MRIQSHPAVDILALLLLKKKVIIKNDGNYLNLRVSPQNRTELFPTTMEYFTTKLDLPI